MNDNSKIPIFLLVILIGLVFVLALLFNPVTSSPPPTPAIRMINTSSANITASDYNGFVEFIQGTGITISPNYATNEITFSAPGGSGNSTVLSDLGDVQTTSPAYHSIFIFNGSQWTDKLFQLNTQTAANDFQIVGINNQTGAITRNQFSVNTVTSPAVDFQVYNINNATGQVQTNQFSVNSLTCGGTDKISSINNLTGSVICTTDSTGAGGSGIPLPGKKWGELIPVTSSTDTIGLVAGCSILATATYVYDTTLNSGAILSTTAVTDGINGGIHCTGTNRHVFRGDQNAYMYSRWEENKITTNRIFIGFSSSATHLPNNADTILDAISGAGLCIRTSDTVYQFCSNDGTGAMATASLTTSEDTNVHFFEVYTTNAGVTWCGKLDGGTAVCSSTAANIPAITTRMYAQSTGETDGGATDILWTQYLWYLQSDK